MRGSIVICDRFPLRQIRLMDGARSRALRPSVKLDSTGRFLARLENRYYDRILPPDLLIVLRVDPDIAVARKPEEVPRFVRARSEEIFGLDWGSAPAVVLDGTRDRLSVLAEIKSLVWSRL
jgi:thymidylate kinase